MSFIRQHTSIFSTGERLDLCICASWKAHTVPPASPVWQIQCRRGWGGCAPHPKKTQSHDVTLSTFMMAACTKRSCCALFSAISGMQYENIKTHRHTHTCTHISRYHDWHVWWIIVNSPVLLWFCKGMWYSFMWYWHEITAKVIVYVQDLLHYVWQMLSCDERSSFPPLPWITDIEINNGSASLRL